jgi:succinate dehydrogenase/fumarate reductase flavoprotein subunit
MSANPTYDLVIIGSGTGLFAGIAARTFGLSALVVEKAGVVGGSTAMSGGGFWLPGNPMLADAGVEDSPELAREYLGALIGDSAPPERWQAFLDHAPATGALVRERVPITFQHMRDYADYFSDLPGGSWTGRAFEPSPLNLRVLGDDRPLLRANTLAEAAPFPVAITGADYKAISLLRRGWAGIGTLLWRGVQGAGGKLIGREYAAGGQALAAGLILGARAAGVEVWTRSPVRDLLTEDGRIVGVVVERDGERVEVRATRGVVVAAGGFDHNLELRRRHQSEAIQPGWSVASTDNQGDWLDIVEAHGAALTLLEQAWWFPSIGAADGGTVAPTLAERSLPGQIIVAGSGTRFMNEAVNYMTAGQILLGLDDGEPPHLPAWMVMDQRYRNQYPLGAGAVMPGLALPKDWIERGMAHTADTLDELAALLEMPDLPATVARFNVMADQGHDTDFGRGSSAYDRYYGDPRVTPNPCLAALRQPPFHAVRIVPSDLGTCGGLKADGRGRVLSTGGEPIPGLYAIGNAAGNVFGAFYPGPGATIGQGLTFGYIAAAHAAGRIT